MNQNYKIILGIFITVILSGCSVNQRLNKIHDKHPEETANKCGVWYPPKDSIITNTQWLQGEIDTIFGDTIRISRDSIIEHVVNKYIKIPVPTRITQHDTLRLTTTKYQTNTAELDALTLAKTRLTDELTAVQGKLHNRNVWLGWMAIIDLLIVALFALRLYLKTVKPKI